MYIYIHIYIYIYIYVYIEKLFFNYGNQNLIPSPPMIQSSYASSFLETIDIFTKNYTEESETTNRSEIKWHEKSYEAISFLFTVPHL